MTGLEYTLSLLGAFLFLLGGRMLIVVLNTLLKPRPVSRGGINIYVMVVGFLLMMASGTSYAFGISIFSALLISSLGFLCVGFFTIPLTFATARYRRSVEK